MTLTSFLPIFLCSSQLTFVPLCHEFNSTQIATMTNFDVHAFLKSTQSICDSIPAQLYISGNPPSRAGIVHFPIFQNSKNLYDTLKKIAPNYNYHYDKYGVYLLPTNQVVTPISDLHNTPDIQEIDLSKLNITNLEPKTQIVDEFNHPETTTAPLRSSNLPTFTEVTSAKNRKHLSASPSRSGAP